MFVIEAQDVGALTKVRVGHDNKGIGASWYLDHITVKNEKRGEWTFVCNKWLDKSQGDKLIEREIYADPSAKPDAGNIHYSLHYYY